MHKSLFELWTISAARLSGGFKGSTWPPVAHKDMHEEFQAQVFGWSSMSPNKRTCLFLLGVCVQLSLRIHTQVVKTMSVMPDFMRAH